MLHITRMIKVLLVAVLLTSALLMPSSSSAAKPDNSYNVAGIETFLGVPRTDGNDGRTDVRFRGWFVRPSRWQDASKGEGTAVVIIDYIGTAKQGSVVIDRGEWRAWIPNSQNGLTFESGDIVSGSVTWQNFDQCPASVEAELTGYFKHFSGKLDDCRPLLPTIFPTIWGTFSN